VPESLVASVAFALLVGFMLWFALGTQRNIRTGERILRWLEDGLPLLGSRTTLRWLGSSVVELKIVDPAPPFKDAAVLIVLEPRDLAWLWALSLRRGRRDFIILRASLVRAPRVEVDVRGGEAWSGMSSPGDEVEAGGAWRELQGFDAATRAWASTNADRPLIQRAWLRLGVASGAAWRMSVQQIIPHLEVHVRPPALDAVPSRRLLGEFRDLARSFSEQDGQEPQKR
jgi:hypothetical protein